GVVVVFGVPAEALLLEEERAQPLELLPRAGRLVHARAGGEVVEPRERGRRIERRVLEAGEQERGEAEGQLGLGPARHLAERAEGGSSRGRGGAPRARAPRAAGRPGA